MFNFIKQIIQRKKAELNKPQGSFTVFNSALSSEEVFELYKKSNPKYVKTQYGPALSFDGGPFTE